MHDDDEIKTDSSMEDILTQEAKPSLNSSVIDPGKHILKTDMLQKTFDGQDWKDSVMLNQLNRMMSKIKFNEILAKRESGEQSGLA